MTGLVTRSSRLLLSTQNIYRHKGPVSLITGGLFHSVHRSQAQRCTTIQLLQNTQRISQENTPSLLPPFLAALALGLFFPMTYVISEGDSKSPLEGPLTSFKKEFEEIKNGKNILDLSETFLSRSELQRLATGLVHSAVMRIEWHPNQFKKDGPLLETINQVLQKNQQNFEERPIPYICAKFCQLSYKNLNELNQKDALPEGWEVLKFPDGAEAVRDTTKADGYFGVAFINHSTKHVILSHRGTNSLFDDLKTDLLGVVSEVVGRQQGSAIHFTQQILNRTEKLGYRLGIVGHSLGGWLAQLTACLPLSKGYKDIYVVTLDTSGAGKMLENYFGAREMIPMLDLEENYLDFTHYLSLPNSVNTCNAQVGDLFHIIPEMNPSFWNLENFKQISISWFISWVMPSAAYVLKTHNLEGQIAAFDPKSGVPEKLYKVISWPEQQRMGRHYDRFLDLAKENIHIFPETEHLPLTDQYLIKYIARYQVAKAKKETMSLSHFSPREREWLLKINAKQKETPAHFSAYLKSVENKLGIQEDELQNLLKFRINSQGKLEESEIEVFTACKSAWEFRNHVAKLLKIYPELNFLVDDLDISLSLKTLSLVLKDQTKDFIRFCETAIPTRLYLYAPATRKEIAEHKEDEKKLAQEIKSIDLAIKELSSQGDGSHVRSSIGTEKQKSQLEEQKTQLKIMQGIAQAFIEYKSRNFEKAEAQAKKVLKLMETYKESANQNLQLPRLRAGLYSLLAKTKRCLWKQEEDLKKSQEYYRLALDQENGLPHVAPLWGNYGALLNNWGEWLFQEERFDEAIWLHKQALKAHKKAHELSLKGSWLFQDKRFDPFPEMRPKGIKRDYGRALYLLAKAEFDQNKITQEEYQSRLQEAAIFFASKESDSQKLPATNRLFQGIIFEEMGDIEEALKYYNKGLKKQPNHVTLLNRRAGIFLKKNQLDKALVDAEKSREGFLKRGVNTPEDTYRLAIVEETIKKINASLVKKL